MSNNQILDMVEQRIRNEVRPQAEAMADAMHVRLEAEIAALGCSHYLTSLHKFVGEVRDQYSEKLVKERHSALADRLIGAADAATTPQAGINVATVDGAKVTLIAGDTLVLSLPHVPSKEQIEALTAHAVKSLPDGVKVLVLGAGITLAAVTRP